MRLHPSGGLIQIEQKMKILLVVQNLITALLRMFSSSKELFVRYLPRRIDGMESAGKRAAINRKKPSHDWLEKDQ